MAKFFGYDYRGFPAAGVIDYSSTFTPKFHDMIIGNTWRQIEDWADKYYLAQLQGHNIALEIV